MKRLLATLLCMGGLTLAQASDLQASLDDILLLANRNVSDQTIMVYIQTRGIGFSPSAENIDKLLEAGISEEIIRYLLEQSPTATVSDNSYQQRPTYMTPYPTYYYYPYYSRPRFYYGFSGLLQASYIHYRAERHLALRHTTAPGHSNRKHHRLSAPPLHHGNNQAVHIRSHNSKSHTIISPEHGSNKHAGLKSTKNSAHGKKHSNIRGGSLKGSLHRGHTRTGGGHHGGNH